MIWVGYGNSSTQTEPRVSVGKLGAGEVLLNVLLGKPQRRADVVVLPESHSRAP